MPYSGLTSQEVCALLGLSRQMLKQSGIGAAIAKCYPFGKNSPLYDEHEARLWRDALNRRKALITFGRLNDKAPLLDAIGIDPDEAFDVACPTCHGWAYEDAHSGRVWCPICLIITGRAKP